MLDTSTKFCVRWRGSLINSGDGSTGRGTRHLIVHVCANASDDSDAGHSVRTSGPNHGNFPSH